MQDTLLCFFQFFPLSPSHVCHEWRQTVSLAEARMRQQLILGCPPSLLKKAGIVFPTAPAGWIQWRSQFRGRVPGELTSPPFPHSPYQFLNSSATITPTTQEFTRSWSNFNQPNPWFTPFPGWHPFLERNIKLQWQDTRKDIYTI